MKSTRGFMLVEFLVAFTLFAMVISTMAAIYAMALQGQTRAITATTLGNNATMMGHALDLAAATASYVQVPSLAPPPLPPCSPPLPPCSTDTLVSWDNTNPLDGTILNPSVGGRTFRQLCVKLSRGATPQEDQDAFYRYELANAPWPLTPVSASGCGNDGPGGAPLLIAGGVPGMSINATFTRIGNNILQLSYTLNYALASTLQRLPSVSETTQVTLGGSLQKP